MLRDSEVSASSSTHEDSNSESSEDKKKHGRGKAKNIFSYFFIVKKKRICHFDFFDTDYVSSVGVYIKSIYINQHV
jgi:hypothetical protein